MTTQEALDLAAGHAIGCTSPAEVAAVEALAAEDPGLTTALDCHRATVAALDILMSLTPAPPVWERIAQSLD